MPAPPVVVLAVLGHAVAADRTVRLSVLDPEQAPLAGATATFEAGADVRRATTDAGGEVRFDHVPDPPWVVRVEAWGFETWSVSMPVAPAIDWHRAVMLRRPDSCDVLVARDAVSPDPDCFGASASLELHVEDAPGAPLAGTEVRLETPLGAWTFETDAAGALRAAFPTPITVDVEVRAPAFDRKVRVRLEPGEQRVETIRPVDPTRGALRVAVVDGDDTPLTGARIRLAAPDGLHEADTDEAGRALFPGLPSGEAWLTVVDARARLEPLAVAIRPRAVRIVEVHLPVPAEPVPGLLVVTAIGDARVVVARCGRDRRRVVPVVEGTARLAVDPRAASCALRVVRPGSDPTFVVAPGTEAVVVHGGPSRSPPPKRIFRTRARSTSAPLPNPRRRR